MEAFMNRSIAGVVTFLQDNDSLIKQLMETAESATNDIAVSYTHLIKGKFLIIAKIIYISIIQKQK